LSVFERMLNIRADWLTDRTGESLKDKI